MGLRWFAHLRELCSNCRTLRVYETVNWFHNCSRAWLTIISIHSTQRSSSRRSLGRSQSLRHLRSELHRHRSVTRVSHRPKRSPSRVPCIVHLQRYCPGADRSASAVRSVHATRLLGDRRRCAECDAGDGHRLGIDRVSGRTKRQAAEGRLGAIQPVGVQRRVSPEYQSETGERDRGGDAVVCRIAHGWEGYVFGELNIVIDWIFSNLDFYILLRRATRVVRCRSNIPIAVSTACIRWLASLRLASLAERSTARASTVECPPICRGSRRSFGRDCQP